MVKVLNENEKKLIRILKTNADNPLTYEEMAREINVKSTNTIAYYIRKLKKFGFLKVNPHNPRDYCILQEPDDEIVYLPVYAIARCGPSGIQNEDAVIDKVAVSGNLLPYRSQEMIIVKAKGDSMQPTISDKDLVLVRSISNNCADDGDIVLVSTVNDGTFIKEIKLKKSKKLAYLVSHNRKYSPIAVERDKLRIHGIVKGSLINYYR